MNLLNVTSGEIVWQRKGFYDPTYLEYFWIFAEISIRGSDSTDLNIGLINLAFSPDGHYFGAGVRGRRSGTHYLDNIAEAVDLNTFAKVPLSDSLKRLFAGGFTFMGNDRIVGINAEDFKKSGVASFPAGEVLQEMELWRKGMATPTRGDYLLVRPIKDHPLGVLDLKAKAITKVNDRAALDIFDDVFVAERRNGELGLYQMAKNEIVATTFVPEVTLGRLRVAELSSDMKWLALSGRSRGGVWNLANGEAVLSLRGFEGGHLSNDNHLYADFPKYEEAERNVARFDLATGEVTPGPKIEARTARQIGEYLFIVRSAKSTGKEGDKESGNVEYGKNVVIDMLDARTMTPLWSKNYPKEAPRVWIASSHGTAALVWNLKDEAAKIEIKNDPRLSQQVGSMNEKEGDYFVQILNAQNGNELGKLLIETGKGSFRLSSVYAAGDWVIVTDTQNRVLLYSLKTGQLVGRAFGGYATISTSNNLLCVENEIGKLAVYDLNGMNKLDEFVFSSPISMLRFSPDSRRLFVLTSNQTVYFIDVSSLPR